MDEKTYKFIKMNFNDYSDRNLVAFYFIFCEVFIFIQYNRNAARNFQEKVYYFISIDVREMCNVCFEWSV